MGIVVLGVTDAGRAAEFWRHALGYELREDGLGGWATVLMPPSGSPVTLEVPPAGAPVPTGSIFSECD